MKLVFVHGAGSSSLSFYYQLRHFRNSKALDLPGHPVAKPCTSIEGYVEWVRGFNAARRYKDVVLCGHSMGGAIGLLYTLRYPEELRGLILIGTGARLRVHPKYLNRCQEHGEELSRWLEGQREYYKAVEPDLYQALMRRANEIGPAVELNDLLCCDRLLRRAPLIPAHDPFTLESIHHRV
ncbi:MAG: alpha/beta hydrolase [candidate division NC10 bacterium]